MALSLLKNKDAIQLYATSGSNEEDFCSNMLSAEQWTDLSHCCILLEPLATATIRLEGSEYCTMSLVLPTISILMEVFNIQKKNKKKNIRIISL
jgi:hypothetical protein